jgi:hypothetical protein
MNAIEAEALAGAGLTPAIERLEAAMKGRVSIYSDVRLSAVFASNLIDLLTRCRDTLEAQSAQLATAPEMLSATKRAYAVLADVHHSWKGRDSMSGQGLLCDLRDSIAAAEGRTAQDVQDGSDK